MIAYLEGTLLRHTEEGCVLLVGGVGYAVAVARPVAEVGQGVKMWIEEVIREDRHDLYGFADLEEKRLFGVFTGVQGVGPKLALKILAAATADQLITHIHTGDVDFFTAISGIGKKTAQKIILDLKGVLVDQTHKGPQADEVSDALQSLGYRQEDIRAILPHLPEGTAEVRIKAALQALARYAR
jgi:Holliday junction DNA helicase RuvA